MLITKVHQQLLDGKAAMEATIAKLTADLEAVGRVSDVKL